MKGFQTFTVGQPFRFRDAETRLRNREVFILEWDRSGYVLIIALPGMTGAEAETIKRNKVRVGALIEGAFVLPFWRFVGSPLFGETPFDPTAYRVRLPESVGEIPRANLITAVGLDSTSMLIRALRVANLPAAWQLVVAAWKPAWLVFGNTHIRRMKLRAIIRMREIERGYMGITTNDPSNRRRMALADY